MIKKLIQNIKPQKSVAAAFSLAALMIAGSHEIRCQTSVPNADSPTVLPETAVAAKTVASEPAVSSKTVPETTADKTIAPETSVLIKPAPKPETLKVTFDQTTPGVVIVESNGQKFRIDSNKQTTELIAAAATENVAEKNTPSKDTADKAEQTPPTVDKKAQAKAADSAYDFDTGEEPFDYRLINVPTPKSVPKGSWNLLFTHRFSQPIHPLSESGKALLGFDSFSSSSFGLTYGITGKLSVSAYRQPICQKGLCRTIEIGLGYQLLEQSKKSPFALRAYASVEGNENFTQEYTYNLQAMMSSRLGKRVYLFFSPAIHLNSNGQHRFNPRPEDFFPIAAVPNTYKLLTNGSSFGFGTSVLITPTILGLFEFTPRTGFKLGQVNPIFDSHFNVTGFTTVSYPEIGFGLQKNIGKHAFTLTFSNTQTTTTSRYNSSNLVLSPKELVIGFNLFRRW